MAIERKQFTEKVEKKKVDKIATKKVKRSLKTESLPDAIVEGKFVGQIGSEIVVSRFRNGKNALHVCTVKEIGADGVLHTWDETLQQWFIFPVKEGPQVVKLMV